ncbi:MAG: efflux RND transporter periplasmic adaptor subunit [Gammaproteobacteria bacterium]|nr:efflux RND transporter periplasmic adaptor subunit [Gammaproteobacteria bacterium]MBU1654277.1 efflux RND transporter periplasmic adaptor subunit [Gammaproteobacteria bacterium]MBU1960640.1 efflux RND transporter periplasmic adaptor subunit [Gammaproteobacteria bacterium]
MKEFFSTRGRTLALAAVLIPLLALFAFAALRSGPLAPVPVTLTTVERLRISPALFGIGIVEARFTHRIGPTFAGRIRRVEVQPGDRVEADQLLGEMDPIDLDDRVGGQDAAIKRAEATVMAADAQIREAAARSDFAGGQANRYSQLLPANTVSKESVDTKHQEYQAAKASLAAARANLEASRQELARLRAEREGLIRQRANLRLVSPVRGLVTRRDADPGTTVLAGQAVVEVVEPGSIWLNVRFDQQRALGLQAGLPARILLRSQGGAQLAGRVARVEPLADAVTEEILAKVEFERTPSTPPPIGELAEVTLALAKQEATLVVPNASVQRFEGRVGVWVVEEGSLRFAPVKTGMTDLDGRVQILEGLSGGEQAVVYSYKGLSARSRIKVVDRILGKSP